MSRKSEPRTATKSAPHADAAAPAGSLAGLTAIGGLSALWSLFLWTELLAARRGGAPAFCGAGEVAECTALWNAPFASAIHQYTGLPLAAWGVVWGITAFALPLLALWARAEGRSRPALLSAIRLTAAAGTASVLVFLAVALTARTMCLGCFATYVMVAGYAGIALQGWKGLGWPEAQRGAILAGSITAAGALLLLYPGLQTPRSADAVARDAVASAPTVTAAGTGDPERDRQLTDFIASLAPPLRQTLADSLHIASRSPVVGSPAARHLTGPATAPVRIMEWTDVLCDHCAQLHATMEELRRRLPEDSFSIDSRQFPLDGSCNPMLQPRPGPSVRCLAAKAQICVPGEKGWEYAGALFAEQKSLTPEKVYTIAAPYMARKALEACIASDATQQALEEDVRLAAPHEPDATPIVVVNGRRGTSFGPFLYAMVLTGGRIDHPAFRTLPPPNPEAHLH